LSKDTKREYASSDPRKAALYAVDRIENGGFSNIIINDVISKGAFSHADRALFTTLTRGVTERRLTLDYIINSLSSLPPSKIDADARNILRLGIYQLAFMDGIPNHAAVNECVNLCRKRSKGFVNAVLRNFIRGGCKYDLPTDVIERMSVECSASCELCERFTSIFGYEKARAILQASFGTGIDLCVNTLKCTRDQLIEKISSLGYTATAGTLSPRAVKTDAPYSVLDESLPGCFYVMDEASQCSGEALGMLPGESLIDVCSAPGSKSFYAAISMENCGEIRSFDLHASKISLINKGAERLGIDIITAAEADGTKPIPELFGKFDCVLCDVPCSGLGVIGGKPEIKYKSLEDFKRLPGIQRRILDNAKNYVKAGGRLVYSTCTVLPEENEENVRAFLSDNPEFTLENITLSGNSFDGMITFTPDNGITDGFFIARMRRTCGK
jgi:16S rRNA (cytosine967-C5)-methyltransferase